MIKEVPNLWAEGSDWYQDFNREAVYRQLGIQHYQSNEVNILLFVVMLAAILSLFLWSGLQKLAKQIVFDSQFDTVLQNIILVLKQKIVPLTLLVIPYLFTLLFDFYHEVSSQVPNIFAIGILYALCIGLLQFCFLPPTPALPYCEISKTVAQKVFNRSRLLFRLSLISALIFLSLYNPEQYQTLNEILLGILITAMALIVFSILIVINNAPQFLIRHKFLRGFFSLIITFILFLIITCQWVGYQSFAKYLLLSTLYTIGATFLIWFVYSLYNRLLSCFTSRKYKWELDFQKFLQIMEGETPLEVTLLKLFGFFIFCVSVALVLNEIWSISEWWSYQVNQAFFQGFIIGDSKIIPFRIILSILVLALGMLSLKTIKQIMISNIGGSSPAQEAHIMIMSYIFHTGLILFALVVGGFNLSGLALVAGALSVGIGFGLQNIVNNFVSELFY